MKIFENKNSLGVRIPKAIATKLGLAKGDNVKVKRRGNKIIIEKEVK